MKQHVNRIFSILLALVLCVGLFASIGLKATAVEGSSGENLTWTLENGVLTISGSGEMQDFTEENPAPWLEYAEQIQCVKVADGVTKIGKLAFYHCTNLTSVSLSATVKSLGKMALAGCYNLTQIKMPGVEVIGWGCFFDCTALQMVSLPECLRIIDDKAFYHCTRLAGITIPANVESMGSSVFSYCENLVYVNIESKLVTLPYWSFYGCDRLNKLYLPSSLTSIEERALSECPSLFYVYFSGSDSVEAEIEKQLEEETLKTLADLSDTQISYEETEGATIVVERDVETGTTVSVVVTDTSAWPEVAETIDRIVSDTPSAEIDIQIEDGVSMPEGALNNLSNQDTTITIQTPDNVEWEIALDDQTKETLNTVQNFKVSFVKNTVNHYASVIGNALSYTITLESTGLNSTVYLPLGIETARQVATLYQINGSTLERLCSVVIDDQGKAAFPLAGTTPGQYILALNVEGISSEEVRIPNKLAGEYGDGTLMDIYGNKYIVTGMSNQLGFGAGTMGLIILGILVGSAVVIGVVMTMWNRQRKKAYAQVYGEEAVHYMPTGKSGKTAKEKNLPAKAQKGEASVKKISLLKKREAGKKTDSKQKTRQCAEAEEKEEAFSSLEEKMRRRKENAKEKENSRFRGGSK